MKIDFFPPFLEGCTYHIYGRGNNAEKIFPTEEKRALFLRKFIKYCSKYFHIYAFCVLPDHYHILLEVKEVDEAFKKNVLAEGNSVGRQFLNGEISLNRFLENQFMRFLNSYAQTFNRSESRKGSVFQKRFRRPWVKNEMKKLSLVPYINRNPIHHNWVDHFSDWDLSSYNPTLTEEPSILSLEKIKELYADVPNSNWKQEFLAHHAAFKADWEEEFEFD